MVKRGIDIVGAGAGLIVLAVPMGAIALAVHRVLGTPVLFKQPRPGKNGRLFTLYKFRTMRQASPGAFKGDEERLTSLGEWLRRSSLDELPELVNVLRGDMSLVGPRPLLPEYLPRYNAEQSRRHNMKPGITGWAQVNGRNALTWPQKFELDLWYVDNWSLELDLNILWRTLLQVLRREGISAEGHATMPEFMGNQGDM
jgi:lipopolysaccharide/colanic/teichoic acid biosynthesis glycosyltransferase